MGNTKTKEASAKTKGEPDGPKVGLDDFVLLKTIGRGSFGKVMQVRYKATGQIYAMKVLKKETVIKRKQYEHTLSERRILQTIEHPFIVSLRFAFQSENKLYMVVDFFNGGEIYHYLSKVGSFSEERTRFYAAQLILALEYLHENGIVYRDLKPENLILDASGNIKVCDFGLSKDEVYGDTVTSICGTPEYLAPEILRKQPYGKSVDWWSLGTVLFEMMAGLPPFYDTHRQRMYRKILEAEFRPPDRMSVEAADLCRRLLHRVPERRLGARSAAEVKRHAFFAGMDWGALIRGEIPAPFRPKVEGDHDVGNISSEFTREPALVTPSPAQSHMAAVVGDSPKSFGGFTYSTESVLSGGDAPADADGGDALEDSVEMEEMEEKEGKMTFEEKLGEASGEEEQ